MSSEPRPFDGPEKVGLLMPRLFRLYLDYYAADSFRFEWLQKTKDITVRCRDATKEEIHFPTSAELSNAIHSCDRVDTAEKEGLPDDWNFAGLMSTAVHQVLRKVPFIKAHEFDGPLLRRLTHVIIHSWTTIMAKRLFHIRDNHWSCVMRDHSGAFDMEQEGSDGKDYLLRSELVTAIAVFYRQMYEMTWNPDTDRYRAKLRYKEGLLMVTVVTFVCGQVRIVQATCNPSEKHPTLSFTLRALYNLGKETYDKTVAYDVLKWILSPPEPAKELYPSKGATLIYHLLTQSGRQLMNMVLSNSLPSTGLGLLGMTWRPTKTRDEQAFAAMKAAIAGGATVWSSSSIYGMPPEPPTAGLWLLRRYFEKYPEDAPKVTLFVRGCMDAATLTAQNTRKGVRASVAECNEILAGFKKMDIFGPARMDRKVPVEETVMALKELVEEGQIGAVGLSEIGAATIRRATTVCPIAAVEIEFSLWSTEMLTNGVAKACKEHNVTIIAYAPLGYGFLTGHVKRLEDIPEGDIRHMFGRFQPENFYKNLEIVNKITAFAQQRDATAAQLALAWIRSHSNTGSCGVIIPVPGATAASRVEENCQEIQISSEEKAQLDETIRPIEVAGERQIVGMSDEHLLT